MAGTRQDRRVREICSSFSLRSVTSSFTLDKRLTSGSTRENIQRRSPGCSKDGCVRLNDREIREIGRIGKNRRNEILNEARLSKKEVHKGRKSSEGTCVKTSWRVWRR